VVEPERQFYSSPLSVMDFQSLYPSVIIAYNVCYSTCLGKIQVNSGELSEQNADKKLGVYKIPASFKVHFGFSEDQELSDDQTNFILDSIIVAPNLNCFVKPHIREGLLPRMLREILFTRIMVKKSLKLYEPGSLVYRMLDSRQLALKLIANVTYGYTAAGFSGRMPCVEVADSVVSIGRRSLESAIALVNANEEHWGTEVVYGDTDSMFILCEGKSHSSAFRVGSEIAAAVTKLNPFPMELKFEKIYVSSVILAKKRYSGYKIEKEGETPILDSKGIETIRRDTVEAVAKIMDKTLRIMFECKDVSKVKAYLMRQWGKIQRGDIDIQDFTFAKEVKYMMYKNPPPAAIIA